MQPPTSKPINLQLGWPSQSLCPSAQLQSASSAVLQDSTRAGDALIYGPDPGFEPLRISIASWLTKFYAPSAGAVTSDRIFIGNGASATLEIILSRFTDPLYTRRVFMVEPTYFMACPIFEDTGFEGRLRGVPEDEEGVDVGFLREALEMAEREAKEAGQGESRVKSSARYPKLYRYIIYAVPSFSNPSGKVMSLRRRKEMVQLAREFDALIVTDDVYDMLRWPVDSGVPATELPPAPPRLIDVDRDMEGQSEYGNAASNGSFSKIVAPGCRVGWVESTPAFVDGVSRNGATKSGGSPNYITSVFMDQLLRSGDLEKHLAEVFVPTYRERYAVMMKAIKTHLEPLGVKVSAGQAYKHGPDSGHPAIAEAGGFFTFVTLPDDMQPAERIAKICLDSYRLKIAHGNMMVVAGDSGCIKRAETSFGRGARLSWSWHEADEIQEGIERFAQVLKDVRAGIVKSKLSDGHAQELKFS